MTITDRLKTLIETEAFDEIIDFLKGLNIDEKKELAPELKNLNVNYSEFVDLTTMNTPEGSWQVGRSYGSRARGKQGLMLAIASFICLDLKGFQKTLHPAGMMTREILDSILPWYTPSWFGQLLDEINKGNSFRLDYDLIMHLQAGGYFTPSPELIITHLPNIIYGASATGAIGVIANEEYLLTYPETLDQHFWYLFEYPSNIHNLTRYRKDNEGWTEYIAKYAANGRLDRMRILRESLLTANRNFNKVLAGWFMELFASLKPTKEELGTLQPILMTVLDSKHSTAVNLALNSLKQIKELDYHTFIAHLPQVILSGTKAILTTVLRLSETICKEHEDARQQLAIQLCQIFLNKEEAIQQKAAKLISTYALPASDALLQQLQMYADTMLTSIRQSLFTEPVTIALEDDEQAAAQPLIGEHNLIPPVNTIEELVYFASQAFENNEPYHAELLPAVFINLQHLITDDVRQQLKPALKRAEKLRGRGTNNMGLLDHSLTYFMIRYFNPVKDTTPWEFQDRLIGPYLLLWQYALDKLAAKDSLPLLSTPTHTPGWIDPIILVNRLAQYNETPPNDLDLQIAICRCALEDTTAAIALAKEKLTGDHRELLLFLLDNNNATYKDGNTWIQAAKRKGIELPSAYLKSNLEWNTEVEEYLSYGDYNKETRQYERVPATRISIVIQLPAVTPLSEPLPLLHEYLVKRSKYIELSAADIPRLLSLTPADPSLMLANIIHHYMPLSGLYEVTETTTITAAITWLKDQTIAYTAIEQLFIATCMLHADKTIRAIAAECWITGVSYNRLQSEEIGRIIGTHQRLEWAPLKRFTDLITEQMMQISKLHNEALETLLSACIGLLPDSAVKNLKKLLEVYAEVLVVNGHTVTDPKVKNRLEAWVSLSGFKQLVSKLTA